MNETFTTEIKLLSHASILINAKGLKILTDPWFFGTAFNDGWDLSPEPDLLNIEELIADVDLIWISHEHPDHLHFPTLKWVSKIVKKDVEIYFQQTNSKKVFEALTKVGFRKFKSMKHKNKYKISSEVALACYAHRHLDSALAVFINSNFWLLNINDTELTKNDTSIIRKKWGSPSVVYNQFSIAGSEGIESLLSADADHVLNKMTDHHRELNTKLTVPFASYVRFGRSDNNYMNKYANSSMSAKKKFISEDQEMCLQSYNSSSLKWKNIDELPINLNEVNLQSSKDLTLNVASKDIDNFLYKSVSREAVKDIIERRIKNWKKNTNIFIWSFFDLKPITFCVKDWGNEIWVCDLNNQSFHISKDLSSSDIEISSQPLMQAFEMPFGIQTLGVSGRYKFNDTYLKIPKSWKMIRIISSLNNANIHLSLGGLFKIATLRWIWQRREGLFSQIIQQINRFMNK